jgi:hypothetical protein
MFYLARHIFPMLGNIFLKTRQELPWHGMCYVILACKPLKKLCRKVGMGKAKYKMRWQMPVLKSMQIIGGYHAATIRKPNEKPSTNRSTKN